MKLGTEQAFDILPQVSAIYEKVNIKAFIKDYKIKNSNKKKGKSIDDVDGEVNQLIGGLDMFNYIIKQLPKVKQEVFEIIMILEGKSMGEVKKQSLVKTLGTIKEIFTDKELVDFFKLAMGSEVTVKQSSSSIASMV